LLTIQSALYYVATILQMLLIRTYNDQQFTNGMTRKLESRYKMECKLITFRSLLPTDS